MNSPKPIANSDSASPRTKARLLILSGQARTDLAACLSRLLDQYPLERPAAVLIEGLYTDAALDALETSAPRTRFMRLGFGCPCCMGSLPLRVTLTRLLRERVALMVLALSDSTHEKALAEQLKEQFQAHTTVQIVPLDASAGPVLAQSLLKSS